MGRKHQVCAFCGETMKWDTDYEVYNCVNCKATLTPGRESEELSKVSGESFFSAEVSKILRMPKATLNKEPLSRSPIGTLSPGGSKSKGRKKPQNKGYTEKWNGFNL